MSPTIVPAVAPALPLHTAGPYVAAAYIVFVAIILVYVGIMATRLMRNQREIVELRRELDARQQAEVRADAGGVVGPGAGPAGNPEVGEQTPALPRP